MRIAVLDVDPVETAFVKQIIVAAGHLCETFRERRALVEQLHSQTFDLLILDRIVPGLSGEDVLRWVRATLSRLVPVIFMTSRSGGRDIVSMLNAGAHDYVVRPVAAIMLLARVEALLRCSSPPDGAHINAAYGDFEFEPRTKQVRVKHQVVKLSRKEFELAVLLFEHLNRPLARTRIADLIWKYSVDIPTRTVNTHVSVLRAKLGLWPANGYRLRPIYGYGYRLEQIGTNLWETRRADMPSP